MATRTLLLKLEQRGWIVLPPRRQVPSNRMRHKPMPTSQELVWESPLRADLGTLLPLEISEVSTVAGTPPRALFENLLHRHHYLSYRSAVGDYAPMGIMLSVRIADSSVGVAVVNHFSVAEARGA